MKRKDLFVILLVILLASPFFIFDAFYSTYVQFNVTHGFIMSFMKFAILATFGEMIALRMQTGDFNQKGFGILPRIIVWGFLGISIKMAFVIFATGTPVLLNHLGMDNVVIQPGDISIHTVFIAFSISTAMNIMFAPVMMTFHKITDLHILTTGGSLSGFLKPIRVIIIFEQIDWKRQWDFVFKKTIPFFWIPAHTITFLLPSNYQVLFAAMLGIALGIILSFSNLQRKAIVESNMIDNLILDQNVLGKQ